MSKDIGFFNKKEGGETPGKNAGGKIDIGYKDDVTPSTPYDPSIPAKATLVNGDKRGTIRMPLETKHEFDALLEISEYQYTYELLAEMHYLYMQKLSPEQLRLFHAQLENIKRKAALKEAKKQQKK
ncbi:hypothetical protein PDQ69_24230 [Bacillus cereus group sp. Bc062]|uniref:Replication-associated protein n=1 Tax=Bacillus paranthracis TaxID=2026186 RepID=A0AAX3QMH6_9BACI|nr:MULTISPECIES: hypothetical protein [Bacillus]MBE7145050.1 hypothetical protein [Bacillus paranthracis]MCU5211674.1 hypothetical protein [Bacillus paranthracis]MDA2146839.1 hypothetical protein [Bacillus cereus group sp. Bc248]MDA2174746.1 hypothetical protein [Bacillus cereus group sp. Bc247]MDA2588222.1 hypothetical protein [Bacillus cereus group sp. Bc062]